MSSEASARNPELLAEEAAAKFVNEGGCVCSVVFRHPPLASYLPAPQTRVPRIVIMRVGHVVGGFILMGLI